MDPNRVIDLATAAEIFAAEVEVGAQNQERLQNACLVRMGEMGKETHRPVSGMLDMDVRDWSIGNIPISELDVGEYVIGRQNFVKKTVISLAQNTLFAYEDITRHAHAHANLLSRFRDRIKLDAIFKMWDDKSVREYFYTIPKDTGSSTGLNVDKLVQGVTWMADLGIDDDRNLNLWANPLLKKSLIKDPHFSSWDYNVERPYMDGKMTGFMGVGFFWLGSVGGNALPIVKKGNTKTFLVPLVDYESIEVLYNRAPQSWVWYNKGEDRYECVSVATAGSAAIPKGKKTNPENPYPGIVLLECDDPAEPVTKSVTKTHKKQEKAA